MIKAGICPGGESHLEMDGNEQQRVEESQIKYSTISLDRAVQKRKTSKDKVRRHTSIISFALLTVHLSQNPLTRIMLLHLEKTNGI